MTAPPSDRTGGMTEAGAGGEGEAMRLHWTLPVAMALTTWAAIAYLALRHDLGWGDRSEVARLLTPVALLLAAGWFSRHDDSPARHGVTCASLFILPVVAAVACVVLSQALAGTRPTLPFAIEYVFDRTYQVLVPPVVVTLIPAAVGWWQRRCERRVDETVAG